MTSAQPIPRVRGHSPLRMNAALVHNMSTEISTDDAPHSRLVFENAGQVSNQATVASVTAFEIALKGYHVAVGQSWVTLCACRRVSSPR